MSFNILIVDDSRTVHGVITKTLELAQIPYDNLLHGFNGEEGLSILNEHDVDLIFSDIHMPKMDGEEMISRIYQTENLKNIPIVIISTEGSKVRIDNLKSMGVKAFLRKPFTPESLKETVDSVMGEQHGT
jgi:two-component system chemotaxis response regulator CheY